MMYVLGVDGGTTKTVALIADETGRILAAARGGGSNWAGENVEIPMKVVADTSDAAKRRALEREKAYLDDDFRRDKELLDATLRAIEISAKYSLVVSLCYALKEIYDDLQELIRDLKHNPWKFFWRE